MNPKKEQEKAIMGHTEACVFCALPDLVQAHFFQFDLSKAWKAGPTFPPRREASYAFEVHHYCSSF